MKTMKESFNLQEHKIYSYQFSEQKVFASENAPLSFQIIENYAIVAMNNYTIGVYDISDSHFTLLNQFPVCGGVIKVDYCVFDDYIVTFESKDHCDINSNLNNSIRTYHNWRCGGPQNKIRFRAALGTRYSGSVAHPDKAHTPVTESPFLENVIEGLEFLHLSHPTGFSIYTNSDSDNLASSKSYQDIYSNIAISENTYVHLYRFCHSYRKSLTSYSSLSPKSQRLKSNETEDATNENGFYFQHLYTVNFSFIVNNLSLLSRVLAVASSEKVQVIHILEEKHKSDMFSIKMEKKSLKNPSQIELDVEKCWLTAISTARKSAAVKSRSKSKEILGPTQNLDTASITLLRYADSKEMSFETLLFRQYVAPIGRPSIQNIQLVKVLNFDKIGLFIVMRHEIVLYSFCLKSNVVLKIAEYDFKNEVVLSMAFSDHVNLIHVAFSNGDLVTYNSRLCATDLFESNIISKRVTLTRLGKVTLLGLTHVKSSGLYICAYCKFNSSEEYENTVIINPDSWNFYLFSQPQKSDLKKSIINYAEYKGTRKLLQMLLCSSLVFPLKGEVSNKMIEDIIICCLKSESFYMELVPSLLLRNDLTIIDALQMFQTLETKELYDDNLFQIYAKNKLIKADFRELNENHFRWIVIKILQCSVNLLFDVFVSNNLENFLKADFLVIEGINPVNFESVFIKILYYSAHSDYDLVEPLFFQLDQEELKKLLKNQPHLIYHQKHHTAFGWVLNLYAPQIYAKMVSTCFLKNINHSHEFTNLEIAKQVGQCSHILVLEEILRMSLKKNGLLPYSNKFCGSAFPNEKSKTFYLDGILNQESQNNLFNNEFFKSHMNQLLLLYHEFSFNAIEFCPHKVNQACRQIPLWLRNFRHHSILNQFHPFNGLDPFITPHITGDVPCVAMCCQNYLLRLQCFMSWKEFFHFDGKNVIEASCESMNHPAWKSLNFLLLQQTPTETRNVSEIFSFIVSIEKQNDKKIIDLYFSVFGKEISVENWKKIITTLSNFTFLNRVLKYACETVSFDKFIVMIWELKEAGVIKEQDYKEWLERSGRLCHRNTLFDSVLNTLMEESS